MKNVYLPFICFLIVHTAVGQTANSEIDSLRNVIRTTQNDSLRANAHSRLSWLFANRDYQTAVSHNDTAYALFEEQSDLRGLAVSNYKYGLLFRLNGDYEKSLDHLESFSSYFESKQDTLQMANGGFQIGVVHALMGNFEKSLEVYHKTLSFYEAREDQYGMGFTLNSIGNVYSNLQNYSKAIEFFQKSLDINKKLNKKTDIAIAYNNLANVHANNKEFNQALKYYKLALELDEEEQDNRGIALVNMNIGGILIEKQNYPEALRYLTSAYEIQKANAYNDQLLETISKLGLVYMELGNFARSEQLLKQGLERNTNSKKAKRELHLSLYNLYVRSKNSKQALVHYEQFTVYKDSMANENVKKNINELQVKFDTEKKDKEIVEQQLQLQQQQNELQKKQTQYTLMTGFTILLLVSSLMGWFLYQQRQKRRNQEIITLKREQQVKTLESLMEGEEKERLRIAQELHDGVNGDLSAIKYKLTAMVEHNAAIVNEVVAMLDRSSEQVRAISHNLVPPALEKFNLVEALEDYCSTMNDIHVQDINFQHLGDPIQLTKNNEINIYRIVQELVSNSLKHAAASAITVQTSSHEGNIQITVEDNGKGFDPERVESNGIGIKNIESRIEYLKASKDLISNAKGTSWTITIPIGSLNDN